MTLTAIKKEIQRQQLIIPDLGEREMLAAWIAEEENEQLSPVTLIEHVGFGKVLSLLPDKTVERIERAVRNKDGRIPIIRAGLGYEELLIPVIVDGSAIASSSTENFLAPALKFPANYLQPNGLPGRTLRLQARGRHTTLATAATLTFKVGSALTNVIPTTTWAVSGAVVMDTTIQTATMWEVECHCVARTVGSGGTIFAMGDASSAAAALTIASQQNLYLGSAGSATPAAVTVDMTVDQYFSLTGKWSLATAYSIQLHQFFVEALN